MGSQCIEGFKRDEFNHLSASDKQRILKLIAQVSETAYRRGAQHGAKATENGLIVSADKMHEWRYSVQIHRRPYLKGPLSEPWQSCEELRHCVHLFGLRGYFGVGKRQRVAASKYIHIDPEELKMQRELQRAA